MEPNGVGPMPVDGEQRKQSADVRAWEVVSNSLHKGDIQLNKLDVPQVAPKTPSLASSCAEKDNKDEGQATSLPGSTGELDRVVWSPDDDTQYEVRVTILPAVKDEVRRKSHCPSIYHQNRTQLIPRPDNHLCLATTGMICCCCPIIGIVGFIFAMQVDKAYDDGNREGAVWRSKNAKYLSLIAVVFGMMAIVGASFYLIFYHLVPALS